MLSRGRQYGEPPVVGLTALAVWGLGAQQRGVRGAVALLLGLTGTVVGIGIGIMHVTHDTLDLTAVAGLACLAIGLMLLGLGSVALVRAMPRRWKS